MTRDEARQRAVEAAGMAFWQAMSATVTQRQGVALGRAMAAFERAMADAGWRMVRDVGERTSERETEGWPGCGDGWNACRAAMLGDGE